MSNTHQQEYWSKILFPNGVSASDIVWRNPTNPQSLRLTRVGYDLVSKDLPCYTVAMSHSLLPKHYLLLERVCPVPYFIFKLNIMKVYDEPFAVMVTLHAGDLEGYLTNLQTYSD